MLRHGFDWLQHCFNIAMLSLRRADAFPVVASLPLKNSYFPDGEKRRPEMRLLFAGYAMLCNNRRWELSRVSLHVTSRVGDQEQKHFSPLGTKRPFHVNSTKKCLLY